MAHHQAGRIAEAAAAYRAILAEAPDHADSLHLLGLIIVENEDAEVGIALIRRAMAIEPGVAPHYNSLGHGYRRLGRSEDAMAAYRTGADLRPGSAEIQNNLATTLRDLGRHDEAVAHYRRAASLAPEVADLWYNLANTLAETDAPGETELCYQRAIRLRPDHANAQANFGRWLMARSRWADAKICLTEALRLAPLNAGVWNNLGIVSQELGLPETEGCYHNALTIDVGLADAHYNLGCLLSGQGQADAAIASHNAAVAADPGFGSARLAACMAELPIVYRTQAEVAERRGRYAAALEALAASGARTMGTAIGRSQPFFLPYQGQDDIGLQSLYGSFACHVLALTERQPLLPGRPLAGERIRVGIVSGFFRDHTLFKLFLEGWLTHLDRERFEVSGFHTSPVADVQTARCAGLCDRFVQGLGSSAAWCEAIGETAPHVLLYPEVGIDPMAGRLAAMRLAPVQCVTWGQPETTGMPTIDSFLSSEMMEPEGGEAFYTERLVRLPGLGMCYTPDLAVMPALVRRSAEAPVFWSGQALYKYLPRYDAIFPRIAAELGACTFVFIAFANSQMVTDMFLDRLRQAFAVAGLDAARHVVMLPAMSQAGYMEAVGRADVMLDTPGWSGGKSTLDCLAWDPAIVTWPGRFMRGRHTAAILRRIGCEATIAGSEDEYVSIAVRLARDAVWRETVRRAVAAGKHLAFDDRAYIRALETFLAEAAAGLSPVHPDGYPETLG